MKNNKPIEMEENFYISVHTYIYMEYSPRVVRLFEESPISEKIKNLVAEYYWGGNSVAFTAGQIVDLLKSKYPKKAK